MNDNHDELLWDALLAYREKRISLRLFRARLRELGKDDDTIDLYTDEGGDDD